MKMTSIPHNEMLSMFGLRKDFTIEELKAAYKRLVMKCHPDVTRDSSTTQLFQIVTACFKALHSHLVMRTQQAEFHELKAGFDEERDKYTYVKPRNIEKPSRKHHNTQTQQHPQSASQKPVSASSAASSFDLNMFNKLYSKHRIHDPNDEGYEAWKKDEKTMKEKRDNTIVVYAEPKPMVSNIGKSHYYELGVDKVRDFSQDVMADGRTPMYSDLRVAHTTQELVNVDKVKQRKDYASVQALENDRASMPTVMNDEEMRAYVRMKKKEELVEAARQKRLSHFDNRINESYAKNHLLIANKVMRK